MFSRLKGLARVSDADVPVRNISDTALWVAHYRAEESARPDAVFYDPYAKRMAGARGARIAKRLTHGRRSGWSLVARTVALDRMILREVEDFGCDVVINLAAGCDTRAYRLPLPPTLRWVDVDLPDLLTYKASILLGEKPRCRYETVAADLSDAAVRQRVLSTLCRDAKHAMVITEGLLIYLTQEQVVALAQDLRREPAVSTWLADIVNTTVLARLQQLWGTTLQQSPMVFAPPGGTAFFEPLGWRETGWTSQLTLAQELHRLPWAIGWSLRTLMFKPQRLARVLRSSGVVHLGRV